MSRSLSVHKSATVLTPAEVACFHVLGRQISQIRGDLQPLSELKIDEHFSVVGHLVVGAPTTAKSTKYPVPLDELLTAVLGYLQPAEYARIRDRVLNQAPFPPSRAADRFAEVARPDWNVIERSGAISGHVTAERL